MAIGSGDKRSESLLDTETQAGRGPEQGAPGVRESSLWGIEGGLRTVPGMGWLEEPAVELWCRRSLPTIVQLGAIAQAGS